MEQPASAAFAFAEEEFPKLSTYKPLDRNTKQIRLLSMPPCQSTGDQHLTFTTVIADLASTNQIRPVEYYALSYCWGEATTMRPIQVDEEEVHLREGVWRCLHHLNTVLGQQSSVLLWLDVLCINQTDVAERNHQVSIMQDIYREARSVFAYLGEQTPATTSFLKYTNERGYRSQGQLAVDSFALPKGLPSVVPAWMAGVEDIILREYFTRLWVIQEAALAKELHLLIGTKTLKLEDLILAQHSTPADFHTLSVACGARARLSALDFIRRELSFSSQPENSLSALLHWFGDCKCRDPRDNIYALLALTGHRGSVEIDYRRSPTEVWWNAFVVCNDRSYKGFGIYDQDIAMALMKTVFQKMHGQKDKYINLRRIANITSQVELSIWSGFRLSPQICTIRQLDGRICHITRNHELTKVPYHATFEFPWYSQQKPPAFCDNWIVWTSCLLKPTDCLMSLSKHTPLRLIARTDSKGCLRVQGYAWVYEGNAESSKYVTVSLLDEFKSRMLQHFDSPIARMLVDPTRIIDQTCSVMPGSSSDPLAELEQLYRDENWYQLGLRQLYVKVDICAVLAHLETWPSDLLDQNKTTS